MGGGTIRAASKLSGIAATSAGFRGISAEHLPVSSAARKAGQAFPGDAAAEGVKMVASKSEAAVQKPCSGIDDWVLAGGEEEEVVAGFSGESMTRVIFGGVPTLQEAKEATSELTVALEKTYLSSPSPVGYKGCVEEADNDSNLTVLNRQIGEDKACVAVGSAVPAPAAMMAFRFLHESSMVQNVVASIASDRNVWNAVSQNKELQEFLQSQKECSFGDDSLNNMKLVADSDFLNCSSVSSSDDLLHHQSEPGEGFMDMLQKIKITVVEMMNNLSDYFQSFFGGKGSNGVDVNCDGTARLSGAEVLMEGSFMGLAVMAILVILLKRV